mgnify:CR=1 FL=1
MTSAVGIKTTDRWLAVALAVWVSAAFGHGTSMPAIAAVGDRAVGESPSRPEARVDVRPSDGADDAPIAGSAGESSFVIPGFWSLQLAQAQEELGLGAGQVERLRAIALEYQQAMREDAAPLADAPPEDRLAAYDAMRRKQIARLESARRAVEQVLTPEQLDRLLLAELRTRGAWALQSPQIQEQLGLSAEQRRKLRENREQLTRRSRQLQQEALEESLRVLSPEQLEKLRAMHARAPVGRSSTGTVAAP